LAPAEGTLAAAVAQRVSAVRQRIAAAGGHDVRIVAVTKRFGAEQALAAVAAGCSAIGENYAQEVLAKWGAGGPAAELQFIGQLQSNKVRLLAGIVDLFATLDRAALVGELAKRSPGARVFVQVDTSGEAGKGGCPLGGVPELVARAVDAGLAVEGLMTVGPTEGGPEAARPGFAAVRRMVDRLALAQCSMGMSDDLEIAVQEGSTQVRLGTALFGRRDRPPSVSDN
jgi:pyridoxal phosphate enzyme (YggS family)